jgi:hypothetical protein
MKDDKKKSFMEKIMNLKRGGRVKDEGVKKGKKSIAEIIGMKRKEKRSKY